MPFADLDALGVARDQGAGHAEIRLPTQQSIRVEQTEGEADHSRDRRQGDVALLPVEAHAEHLFPVECATANHAGTARRGGVAAGLGFGQGETGHVVARGEARQVVILLFLGAVMQQQFRGPERVRHHHRDGGRDAAGRHLGDHRRMADRGEAEAAIALRNDHAEEPFALEERPDFRRQITVLLNPPVVDQRAQFLDRTVEESLLGRRQRARLEFEELLPVRLAGEQIAVPPHGTRLERDPLGFAHRRENFAHHPHQRRREQGPADRRDSEEDGAGDDQSSEGPKQAWRLDIRNAPRGESGHGGAHPGPVTAPEVKQDDEQDQSGGDKRDREIRHGHSVP